MTKQQYPDFFTGCQDSEAIRERYRKLALQHHPDRGGDTATMQEINRQYALASANARASANPKQSEAERQTAVNVDEAIRQALERIIRLDGIEIEVCGAWLWVTGNTYPVRQYLKDAGFRFSRKKVSWYFAGIPCHSKRSHSMDYIRNRYGSAHVERNEDGYRVAA